MTGLPSLTRGRFLVMGRAGLDLYADPPGSRSEQASGFSAALGGSAANIAVALVRQGMQASLLTCVSDDAVGRFCLNQLDFYGVERSLVRVVGGEARTSLAVVETRVEDHQSVIYRNGAADFQLDRQDVEAVDYGAFDALVVTGTVFAADPSRSAAFQALHLARVAGMPLILDLDYRPYSWTSAEFAAETLGRAAGMCDIVIGNDVEWGLLAGNLAAGQAKARALAGALACVVYKMGADGAVTFGDGAELRTGIFATEALKPVGAGDAFLGCMIAALARGSGLETAVLRGSAAAAMVVARVGCAPAMPTVAELDDFIRQHPGPA